MSRPPRCPRTRLRQPQQHMGTLNPTSARHLGHTVGILRRLLEANCLFLHWLLSNFCTREFCTGFGRGCGFWPRQKPHSPKHRWGRRRDSGPWSVAPTSLSASTGEATPPSTQNVFPQPFHDTCVCGFAGHRTNVQQVCLVGSLTVCKASGTNARQNFGGRGPVN